MRLRVQKQMLPLLVLGSAATPTYLFAQPVQEGSRATLEEVVVTAQRREASVQDVSASVSVLSAEVMDSAGVFNTEDLQTMVPGLVVARDIGLSTQIFIRGIGNNILGIGTGNSVATYVDGVYLANSVQTFQNFNDVAQVEVLKGPQAVLWGRNATGGAILVTSKKPSFDAATTIDAAIGNYDMTQVRMTTTGGLTESVAGRLSLQYSERDGWSQDAATGADQDFSEVKAARGELLFEATEDLSLRFAADYADINAGDFRKATNLDSWIYQLTSDDQFVERPRERFQNVESSQPSEDWGARFNIDWLTPFGDITSVTSYRDFEVGPVFFDNDSVGVPINIGIPIQIAFVGDTIGSEQFYHETFLSTNNEGPWQAIVGFNYFDESTSNFTNRFAGPVPQQRDRSLDGLAYSAYVDFSYDLSETIRLIAGARYSYEEKDFSETILDSASGQPLDPDSSKQDWNEVTPRFGIEYRPDDSTLIYLTATNGFKSGGFNENDASNDYDPETVWSFEAGFKTEFAETWRFNAAAFYYEYDDLQVQRITLPDFSRLIQNAASANIYGLDLEMAGSLGANLSVGANVSLLRSEYGDFNDCVDLLGPCSIPGPDGPIPNPVSNINLSGNQLQNAPELTAAVFAEYTVPSPVGAFSLRADASYRSEMYFSPYEAEVQEAPNFLLLGGELRLESNDGRWFASLFGRNLTDELYETWIANVARFLGPGDGAPRYVTFGPPRTYGLRVGMNF